MPSGRLLARREDFGYIFVDQDDEWLFAVETSERLDFSRPERFLYRNGRGELTPAESIRLVASQARPATGRLSAPTYIELYPTMSCNEKCSFCFAGQYLNANGPQLPLTRIEPLLDNIVRAGVFQLVILGGEPFLYRHLPELLDAAATRGLIISLSTNATVDRQDVWERCSQYDVHLNLSLHAPTEDLADRIVGRAGAFRRVVAAIDRLVAGGRSPHVSIVITRDNAHVMSDTVRFLTDRGVESLTIFHAVGQGYMLDHLDRAIPFKEFAEIYEQARLTAEERGATLTPGTNYAFALQHRPEFGLSNHANLLYGATDGRRVAYVLNDGTVLASFYNQQRDTTIGNLFADELTSIWAQSAVLQSIRKAQTPAACATCAHVTYCRGGVLPNRWPVERALPACPIYDPGLTAE